MNAFRQVPEDSERQVDRFAYQGPPSAMPSDADAWVSDERAPTRFWAKRYEFVRVVGACWSALGIISLIGAVASVFMAYRDHDANWIFFAIILVAGGLFARALGRDHTTIIHLQSREFADERGPHTEVEGDA